MRGSRRKMQECADRIAGAPACPQFEHLAEQDQRGDDGSGFEINIHSAVHAAERRREELREQRCGKTVEISSTGAKADQGEHVGAAIAERSPEALEEGPAAPEHHRRGQKQLDGIFGGRIEMEAQGFAEHGENEQREARAPR